MALGSDGKGEKERGREGERERERFCGGATFNITGP